MGPINTNVYAIYGTCTYNCIRVVVCSYHPYVRSRAGHAHRRKNKILDVDVSESKYNYDFRGKRYPS
jgi:hypothetical protein